MYEYQILRSNPKLYSVEIKLNDLAKKGWRVIKVSEDFTQFLLEREVVDNEDVTNVEVSTTITSG